MHLVVLEFVAAVVLHDGVHVLADLLEDADAHDQFVGVVVGVDHLHVAAVKIEDPLRHFANRQFLVNHHLGVQHHAQQPRRAPARIEIVLGQLEVLVDPSAVLGNHRRQWVRIVHDLTKERHRQERRVLQVRLDRFRCRVGSRNFGFEKHRR